MCERITSSQERLFQQIVEQELKAEACSINIPETHHGVLEKTIAKVYEVIGDTRQITIDALRHAPLQARQLANQSLRMMSAVMLLPMTPSPANVNMDIAQNRADNVAASATGRIHYDDDFSCSGFVAMGNDNLVTAGHCIVDDMRNIRSIVKITFGGSAARGPRYTCTVKETFVHPSYKASLDLASDIGVIKLNCPGANPIGRFVGRIGITPQTPDVEAKVTIKGYPKTGNGNLETRTPKVTEVSEDNFFYKPSDTGAGFSGSSVYVTGRDGLPYAAGVHSGVTVVPDQGGRATRINDSTLSFLRSVPR